MGDCGSGPLTNDMYCLLEEYKKKYPQLIKCIPLKKYGIGYGFKRRDSTL